MKSSEPGGSFFPRLQIQLKSRFTTGLIQPAKGHRAIAAGGQHEGGNFVSDRKFLAGRAGRRPTA
jgi:hypothetical protein